MAGMNDPGIWVECKKLSLEVVDSLDTLREEMHEAGQRQMGLNDPTGYNSSNAGKIERQESHLRQRQTEAATISPGGAKRSGFYE